MRTHRLFQPGSWAWGLSLGLHLAAVAWLGCTRYVEPPRTGIEPGEQQCPTLVMADLPGTGNAPAAPSQKSDQIPAPSLPVESPTLSAMLPAPQPTLPPPDLQESPPPCTGAALSSTPPGAPAEQPPQTASRSRRLGSAKNNIAVGKPGGSCMQWGSEGAPTAWLNPPPEYPLSERLAGHEGTVILWIRIESNGTPSKVSIATSSGFALLDASAYNTVSRHWRFKAAQQSGVPIAAEFLLPIRFALKEHCSLTLR